MMMMLEHSDSCELSSDILSILRMYSVVVYIDHVY